MFTTFNIVAGIIVLILLWAVWSYNSLIRMWYRIKEAWSDIDVQLKRRYDLIPNIVETVKGYAAHEKGAFENVTKARAMAMGAQTVGEHSKAENMLTGALKSLFAVSEAYPDLKASENFKKLQDELSDTENKIQAARRFYNSTVMEYNTSVDTFPTNIVAGSFGFKESEFFDIDEAAEREPVKVSF